MMEESTMIKITSWHTMYKTPMKEDHPKTKLSHYLGYCQSGAPLVIKNVKANGTMVADVRVKNLCAEINLKIINYVIQTTPRTETLNCLCSKKL